MIANPKWFQRRKYTGWGITPKTWQGWVYLLGMSLLLMMLQVVTKKFGLSLSLQLSIVGVPLIIFMVDILNIIINLDKDERETQHEAIAERNVAWTMIIILSVAITYQTFLSIKSNMFLIDPFIIAALVCGVIVKAVTNWYLLDK